MAYRDIKNSIDTAKQEGKNEKALEIAKNMLADGVDINLIKKYSGLSQEQIEKKEINSYQNPPSYFRKPDGGLAYVIS